jgi:hypothetical protein
MAQKYTFKISTCLIRATTPTRRPPSLYDRRWSAGGGGRRKKKRVKGKGRERVCVKTRDREIKKEVGGRGMMKSKSEKQKLTSGVVTERDVAAMRWICEQGAMTVEQIWNAVWHSGVSQSPRYAYERVLFLERARFLEKVKTPGSLKGHYRALRTGVAIVSERSREITSIPSSRVPINEIPHVDVLTEVRLAVLRSGRLGEWRTDRMLMLDPAFPRDRFEHAVPDAIWTTKKQGRRVAVEYERTRKGRTRIKQKVDLFARELGRADRIFDLVLWLAAPGSYRDLENVLGTHPGQRLRTVNQFLEELRSAPSGSEE